MSWNYRVCKKRFVAFDPDLHDLQDEFSYEIHEVYYADDHPDEDDHICFTSTDAIAVHGDSIKAIENCIDRMHDALTKPIIDLDTIIYCPLDEEKD